MTQMSSSGYWEDGVWHPPKMRFGPDALREANRLDQRTLAVMGREDIGRWRARIDPSDPNWRSKIPPGEDAKLKELEEGFEYSDPNIEVKNEDSKSIKRPSRIVASALVFMLGLQQLAGMALPFGLSSWKGSPSYPEPGDFFKGEDSEDQDFAGVAELLAQAVPENWRGEAGVAYSALNSVLMNSISQLADVDRVLEQLVNDQAECVIQTQLGLGVAQDSLIAAYPVVCSWEANPSTFNAAFYLAVGVSAAAIVTGVGLLIDCVVNSADNAQRASDVHYSDAIEAAWQVIENYLSALSGGSGSGSSELDTAAESTANMLGEPMVTSPDSTSDGTTDAGEPCGVSSAEGGTPSVRAMRLTPGPVVASRAAVGSLSGRPANLAGRGAVRGDSSGRQGRPVDVAENNGSASGEENTAGPGMRNGVQAPIDVEVTIARPVTGVAESPARQAPRSKP